MSPDIRHLFISVLTGFSLMSLGGALIVNDRAIPAIVITALAWSGLFLLDYYYERKVK